MDFSDRNIIHKSFGWIKENLDPEWSYIIFENDLNKHADSIFLETDPAYRSLRKAGAALKKVYDMEMAREYLVIKIEPGNEDKELGEIMGYGFLENTVSYLYKADKKV
jgi:hypothetical protein